MLRQGMWMAATVGAALFALVALGCGDQSSSEGNTENNQGGGGSTATQVLRVASVLPTSGDNITYGEEALNGLRLAQLDGFEYKGVRVELQALDNASDSIIMQSRVNDAIRDGARLIIGAVASSLTEAGGHAAHAAEVPMLTPASTAVGLTSNPYITRICFTDLVQGRGAADLAAQVLRERGVPRDQWSAVIIKDTRNIYSTGLAADFRAAFEEMGGQVVAEETFQAGDSRFESQINNAAAHQPSVIFIPAYYREVGVMLRQAEEHWQGIPIIGSDGWDSPTLITSAGSALDNLDCYFTSHFGAADPAAAEFVERYERRFSKAPGAMAALGYDAGLVTIDAIKRAIDAAAEGTVPTAEQLHKALNTTRELRGVTGIITINSETREVTKQPVFLRATTSGFTIYRPAN